MLMRQTWCGRYDFETEGNKRHHLSTYHILTLQVVLLLALLLCFNPLIDLSIFERLALQYCMVPSMLSENGIRNHQSSSEREFVLSKKVDRHAARFMSILLILVLSS